MLTRELLQHRTSKGRIRPLLVDVESLSLLALAEDLVAIAGQAPGVPRGEVDDALQARAKGYSKAKVARGLAKLVADRLQTEDVDDSAMQRRAEVFAEAVAARARLPEAATLDDYDRALDAALGGRLKDERQSLYADLPSRRPITAWRPLSAMGLVERYNLALVQGLVIYARRVTVAVDQGDVVEVRRLLRWMKFCRLVGEVAQADDRWSLTVEGPAALWSMPKKYGLHLANFVGAVPIVPLFELTATVELPRRSPATLVVTEKDGLRSPHRVGLGHAPEELSDTLRRANLDGWVVDTAPEPRHVGATGMCVPDAVLRSTASGPAMAAVAIELFHRWHRGPLERRLAQLEERAQPDLFLGIDRSLYRQDGLQDRLAGHPQVFEFNSFPSTRVLERLLSRLTCA